MQRFSAGNPKPDHSPSDCKPPDELQPDGLRVVAHLVVIHLVVMIAAHLVAHLVASHHISGHGYNMNHIVTMATIPQAADFTNGCTNLWSNKEKECIVGASQFLHLTGSWVKHLETIFQRASSCFKHSDGNAKRRFLFQKSPVCSSPPPSKPAHFYPISWDFDTWLLILLMRFPCWQFSHSSKNIHFQKWSQICKN